MNVQFPEMSSDEGAIGVISTWFVESGETVKADQLIGEVAMDKVDAELLAPAGGTITLVAAEGAEVAQGAVIATIDTAR